MRYLSVCSGIEAATVAWHGLGWTPVGFGEIEPFPSAVLAHHYPNVPNFGDMTKHEQWTLQPGSIDLLVAGTPCQSFSVAGLRQGLKDPRGNLMLTYLAIAARLRPQWVVWENVPGVLSSNGGRDFGSFLGAMGELGYGWAYRVLDAQWCRTHGHPRAVPQRRRRVFVVGCLGDWTRAAQVLFERESVQRDSSSRRAKGKGVAADAEGGVGAGCWWDGGQVSETLNQSKCGGGGASLMPDKGNFGAVLQPIGYRWQNNRDGLQQDDAVAAMRASTGSSGFHEMNHPVVVAHAFYSTGGTHGVNQHPEVSPAVKVGSGLDIPSPPAVAFANRTRDGIKMPEIMADGVTPALTNPGGGGRSDAINVAVGHVETLPQQGYDAFHASTQETNAVATLRTLRSQIGEEAFAAWGLGILDSLQPQEVLRARLHGLGIRCATFSRSWPIDCAISRKEDCATWAMQSVREAQGEGCPSPGWQLPQQLAAELGAYLSELPRPGAQTERFVRDLWLAGEGIGFLREALSAFQEARRPAHREGQSALHTMQVRRLTATECEFLQGFPRNYTLIPWRKKQAEDCPDGPRYRALGNSMAVNCMSWIGERIAALENNR